MWKNITPKVVGAEIVVFLNALLRIYVYAVQRAVKDAKLFKAGILGGRFVAAALTSLYV